jgi:hypothetical protein
MRWLNEPLKASLPIFYSFSFYFLFSEIYFILRKPRLTPYRLKSKKRGPSPYRLKNYGLCNEYLFEKISTVAILVLIQQNTIACRIHTRVNKLPRQIQEYY